MKTTYCLVCKKLTANTNSLKGSKKRKINAKFNLSST